MSRFNDDIEIFRQALSVQVVAEDQGWPDFLEAKSRLTNNRTGNATDFFVRDARNIVIESVKLSID